MHCCIVTVSYGAVGVCVYVCVYVCVCVCVCVCLHGLICVRCGLLYRVARGRCMGHCAHVNLKFSFRKYEKFSSPNNPMFGVVVQHTVLPALLRGYGLVTM